MCVVGVCAFGFGLCAADAPGNRARVSEPINKVFLSLSCIDCAFYCFIPCNYAHLSALRYPAVLCRNRPAQHRQATAVAHMGACCKWLQVAPEVSSWPSAVPSTVPVRLLLGSAPQ